MTTPTANHCTFINVGCPEDLCILRYRHHGGHVLSTMAYDTPPAERIPRRRNDCAPMGTTVAELIDLGYEGRVDA